MTVEQVEDLMVEVFRRENPEVAPGAPFGVPEHELRRMMRPYAVAVEAVWPKP